MKILPSGFQSVKSLQKNQEHQICKNKRQISLSVHPFVKQKLCSPFVEYFDPRGDKKFKKKTEEVPDASKKGPRELPRPKMRPTQSRDGLQKGPWDPRGAPETQEAIFGCSKASFASPFGRGMGSQFALKKQCFLHIFVL